MGIAVGSVVSSPVPGMNVQMLRELMGCDLQRIDVGWDVKPRFDTRNPGDVRLTQSEHFQCIDNSRFVEGVLFGNDRTSYNKFLDVTASYGKVIFYCLYDSGDAYGFAMFEDGHLIRRRVYLPAEQPTTLKHGQPLAVEHPWNPAILSQAEWADNDVDELDELFRNENTQELLTERSLTSMLVDAVLRTEFGFSPKDGVIDGQAVREEWYRALGAERPSAEKVETSPRRPWWRRLTL